MLNVVLRVHTSLAVVRAPSSRVGNPHLAKNTGIDGTHELLSQDVEAMRDMDFDNGFSVAEGAFAEGGVVGIVVVERFAEEILLPRKAPVSRHRGNGGKRSLLPSSGDGGDLRRLQDIHRRIYLES
jgi:hypothetical protein